MNQHLSQGRSATSRVAARASLGAAAARGRVDALNTRFAERSAELRRRLAADSEDDAGLESIEVVVLSVVGLGIAIALGAAIKGLVDRYMAQLGGP
ncbi:hypothetical protein [Promicromonospora aerolata]|uniref:Flagellin-like protein n=1 Tax=Promicromonospora aerolata TaxID=195749 RepID=A0ABW4V9I9_9MICO